jgi:hypothetical protein
MPRLSKGLTQAYQVQDFLFDAILALKRSLMDDAGSLRVGPESASAIASLVRGWDSAQERIRIHRGKPLPGSIRPVAKLPKRRRSAPLTDSDPSFMTGTP